MVLVIGPGTEKPLDPCAVYVTQLGLACRPLQGEKIKYLQAKGKKYKSIFPSSLSLCARSVADIGDHGLPILSVVSLRDELIVGRCFSGHKVFFLRAADGTESANMPAVWTQLVFRKVSGLVRFRS